MYLRHKFLVLNVLKLLRKVWKSSWVFGNRWFWGYKRLFLHKRRILIVDGFLLVCFVSDCEEGCYGFWTRCFGWRRFWNYWEKLRKVCKSWGVFKKSWGLFSKNSILFKKKLDYLACFSVFWRKNCQDMELKCREYCRHKLSIMILFVRRGRK